MFWFDVCASAIVIQLAVNTIGPFGCFDKLRDRFPHDSLLGMFHCPWCMSIWAAGAVALIDGLSMVEWLAVAFVSGAIVWSIAAVQDVLSELIQLWRRS